MNIGIGAQISKYSNAVGTKNIGSQSSKTATIQSRKVASGSKIQAPAAQHSRGAIHPGSSDGYAYAKKAVVEANSTGYGNPNYQKGRYGKSQSPFASTNRPISSGPHMGQGMIDYRMTTRNDSSINRLNNIMNPRSI